MITFSPEKLGPLEGKIIADIGAGPGRHTKALSWFGAHAVAIDLNHDDLVSGDVPATTADATEVPLADASCDIVVLSETLEHIPQDVAVLQEAHRILKPYGQLVVTVPAKWPEKVCWQLSTEYHTVPGGHIRIYDANELAAKLGAAGFDVTDYDHHHALHAPYWWLKCAVGVDNDTHPAVAAYHRMLVWDMMSKPRITRVVERALNPILGKSVALYATKAR